MSEKRDEEGELERTVFTPRDEGREVFYHATSFFSDWADFSLREGEPILRDTISDV